MDLALQALTPELGELCRDWRQGDVFAGAMTFVFDSMWKPQQVETMHGAVVVSQSCDASQPGRTHIQLAPVVHIRDPDEAGEAASGRRTQYVAIPQLGQGFFADLDGITTVSKSALVSFERVQGVKTDQEIREFAFSISRRFGRFAYPDDVVECLRPLTKALRSKARREQSPMGKALAKVHSFRVHCEDWSASPYELTLIVILEPDVVPSDPDDIETCPDDLAPPATEKIGDQIAWYAKYLQDEGIGPTERYFAWQYLAEAWAMQCEMTAESMQLTAIVGSVTAELAAVDDFPLSRFLVTESLDLDYLSGSRKANA
ncbi:hypothetical protein [Nocardia sp. NPDC059239]|uniref:hypothetical protein n=1 Tax=unclassified Nocardia TaxID=2637762 RepID=UPI00367DF25A